MKIKILLSKNETIDRFDRPGDARESPKRLSQVKGYLLFECVKSGSLRLIGQFSVI